MKEAEGGVREVRERGGEGVVRERGRGDREREW